jgi:hypothetical protein
MNAINYLPRIPLVALSKPGKDSTYPRNLRPISLLSMIDKLSEKVIPKIVKRHIEERNVHNASHNASTRLTNHVTLI